MANPEHQPDLDGFDRLTVRLYRTGLLLAALCIAGFVALCICRLVQVYPPFYLRLLSLGSISAAVALSAASVHLYDKRFRWFIAGISPLGLVFQVVGLALPETWTLAVVLFTAGLGLSLVSLSALAVKEWFCFRIPGLRLAPIFLGLGVFAVLVDWPLGVALLWSPAAVVLVWLAVRKAMMPLGHDIGDRSHYQV